MKIIKLLLLLTILSLNNIVISQNLTYSNLSQTIDAQPNSEVVVKVQVSCTGTSTTPVSINPTFCVFDNGLTSLTFSNGGYLLPGEKADIIFKFKKGVATDETFTYKFSTNNSCFQEESKMIRITVNYKKKLPDPIEPTCTLPIAQGVTVKVYPKSMILTWKKVPNAIAYQVSYHREITLGDYHLVSSNLECDSNTCTQYIYDLEPNIQYRWNIRAECTSDQKLWNYSSGNWAFGTVSTPPCSDSPPAPTDINAVSINSQQYRIDYNPVLMNQAYSYTMEYIDLTTNPDLVKSQLLYNPNQYSNFLNISAKNTFKFRIFATEGCGNYSEWKTVYPTDYPSDNVGFPTNLSVSSACLYAGGVCGTGIFNWNPVEGAVMYEVQYWIFNYASSYPRPVSGTFQTTLSSQRRDNLYVDSILGPWRINFYVRSKSQSGVWSDFSPSSAYVAW